MNTATQKIQDRLERERLQRQEAIMNPARTYSGQSVTVVNNGQKTTYNLGTGTPASAGAGYIPGTDMNTGARPSSVDMLVDMTSRRRTGTDTDKARRSAYSQMAKEGVTPKVTVAQKKEKGGTEDQTSLDRYAAGYKDQDTKAIRAEIDRLKAKNEDEKKALTQARAGYDMGVISQAEYDQAKEKAELYSRQISLLENLAFRREMEEKVSTLTDEEKAQVRRLTELADPARSNAGNGSGVLSPAKRAEAAERSGIYAMLRGKGFTDEEIQNFSFYSDILAGDERTQATREWNEHAYDARGKAATWLTNVGHGLEAGAGYLDLMGQKMDRLAAGSDAPLDYGSPLMQSYHAQQAGTEKRLKDIYEKHGDGTKGKTLAELYQLSLSMGQSAAGGVLGMAGGAVGGAIGSASLTAMAETTGLMLMATSAATSKAYEAHKEGYSDGQALALATVAGAAEYITEKIPLDSFMDIVNGPAPKKLLATVARQALTEAGEEVGSDVINTVGDVILMGDENQLMTDIRARVAAGQSYAEAAKAVMVEWMTNTAKSALGGAISGGVFGTVGSGIAVMADKIDANTKQNIANNDAGVYNDTEGGAANGRAGEAGPVGGIPAGAEYDNRAEAERDVGRGDPILGRVITPETRAVLNSKGIVDLGLEHRPGNGAFFASSMEEAIATQKFGAFVDAKTAEDIAEIEAEGGRTLINREGSAGLVVTAEGDIEAVFKNAQREPRKAIPDLLMNAIAAGGMKLDCFGIGLANKYATCGFVPVAQVDFNPDINPEWDTARFGTPQVYAMMYTGGGAMETAQNYGSYKAYTQEELDALPRFDKDGYEDALAYRDQLLAQHQAGQQGKNNTLDLGPGAQSLLNAATENSRARQQAEKAHAFADDMMARRAARQGQEDMETPPKAEATEGREGDLSKAEREEETQKLLTVLREHIPYLERQEVLMTVDASGFKKGEKGYTEQAEEYFKGVGGKVVRPNFGEIIIDKRGAKSNLAHGLGRAKAAATQAVPTILRDGIQIDYQEKWKGHKYDTYVFAGKIKIGDTPVYMGAIVERMANNRYYLHEVVGLDGELVKKVDGSETVKTRFSAESTTQGYSEPSTNIIPHSGEIVKENDGDGLGAADAGFDPVSQWQMETNDYHPVNEAAAAQTMEMHGRAPFDMPKRDINGRLTSKQASTLANARITTNEMAGVLEKAAMEGQFSYLEYKDSEAIQKAEADIKQNGWDACFGDYQASVQRGQVSKDISAMGILLYNQAVTSGDYYAAMDVATLMCRNSRNAAQALQVLNQINKMAPQARAYTAMRGVENTQAEVRNKYGIEVEVDNDLFAAYKDALESGDEDAIEKAWYDVEQHIADQIPATFADKLNNWRYMSMLGNPRTHIRNIAGNLGFVPVRAMKNFIAKGLETAFIGEKEGRTQAFLNRASEADRARLQAGREYFAEVEEAIQSGGKYNESAGGIEEKRHIYGKGKKFTVEIFGKSVTVPTNMLEALRRFNTFALDKEDTWFSRPAFANALASWMKANRVTAEMFRQNPGAYAQGIEHAVHEAAKATYRDANGFSDLVASWGRKMRDGTRAQKIANVAVESVIPFRRTPANILVRGVEYSPLGLVKGFYDAAANVKSGKVTAAEAIDEIAAGLTGSVLVALGVLLSRMGSITRLDEEDKPLSGFQKLIGFQNYALDMGNKSYTIDWIAPGSMPLFVGVELANMADGTSPAEIWRAIMGLSDPIVELSMLKGLSDFVEGLSGGFTGKSFISGGISAVAVGYLGQYLPTLAGQLERITEKNRMETYRYGKSALGLGADAQSTLGKLANKIPGLEYHQIPFIDAWGREQSSGSVGTRTVNNLLNPGYVSDVRKTAVDDELMRIYEDSAGEYNVFPARPSQNMKFSEMDGERMTASEFVRYERALGGKRLELVDGFMRSEAYDALSDADRAAVIKDLYGYAADRAKDLILGGRGIEHKTDTDKLKDMEDVAGYFALKRAWNAMKESGGADSEAFDAAAKWYTGASAQEREIADEAMSGIKKLMVCKDSGVSTAEYYEAKAKHDELADSGLKAVDATVKFDVWARGQYSAVKAAALTKNLTFSYTMTAEAAKYDDMKAAGLTAAEAEKAYNAVSVLKPESGKDNVRDIQKYEAVTGLAMSEKKLAAVKQYATAAAARNYQAAYDNGIPLQKWTAVQRYVADNHDSNWNKTSLQAACEAAGLTQAQINAMKAVILR